MKLDTMINLALAAVLFKLVYDANKTVDSFGDGVSEVYEDLKAGFDIPGPTNYAYRGVNWVGGSLSGQENWSLGSAIYDWTH